MAVGMYPSASPAAARGCVLGPSLGRAAQAAGISCPEIDGGSGADQWGEARGSACNFGWVSSALPAGFLDFLSKTSVSRRSTPLDESVTLSGSYYRSKGKLVGAIGFATKYDGTFSMTIDVWGRPGSGFAHESAYFNCATSSEGPIYQADAGSSPKLMAAPGTAPGSSASMSIATQGSLTALGTANHLLRLDVTNTRATRNFVDVQLDLAGYEVEGFPTLPKGTTCEPAEGLVCHIDEIFPGQKVTLVVLLRSTGDFDGGTDVDAAISSFGWVKAGENAGTLPPKYRALVTDFYRIEGP